MWRMWRNKKGESSPLFCFFLCQKFGYVRKKLYLCTKFGRIILGVCLYEIVAVLLSQKLKNRNYMAKEKFPESNYQFFEPNPSYNPELPKSKQILHEDCSIRAICAATEKTWEEVYDLLADAGKKVFDSPTSDMSVEYVLNELGYVKHTATIEKGKKRENVSTFARNRSDKRIVMRIAHHFVGAHDGKYYDSWDCGYKCVCTYYINE